MNLAFKSEAKSFRQKKETVLSVCSILEALCLQHDIWFFEELSEFDNRISISFQASVKKNNCFNIVDELVVISKRYGFFPVVRKDFQPVLKTIVFKVCLDSDILRD